MPRRKVLILELGNNAQSLTTNIKGYTGKGFLEISKTKNLTVTIPVNLEVGGYYSVDFRYANGNGELGHNNKAGIRTLLIDNKPVDSIVFPQRGDNAWNYWGFTNAAKQYLSKGKHTIEITFKAANENMNIDVTQALLDYVRLTKLNQHLIIKKP